MANEEEITDIHGNASPGHTEGFESFIFDSLIRINYQKKIFLDDILNDKTDKTDANPNICVTKRFSPTQIKENQKPILITAKPETNDNEFSQSPNFCQQIENDPPNHLNFSENNFVINKTVSLFPNCYINIAPKKNCKVYDCLFKITGAHLTQNEIIFLRKTVFRKVLPPIRRDEIRNKASNIQCLDKYSDRVMALLKIPAVQLSIRDYVFSRRRKFEKDEMIYNFHQNITNRKLNI